LSKRIESGLRTGDRPGDADLNVGIGRAGGEKADRERNGLQPGEPLRVRSLTIPIGEFDEAA
jgi:hypothetical protein